MAKPGDDSNHADDQASTEEEAELASAESQASGPDAASEDGATSVAATAAAAVSAAVAKSKLDTSATWAKSGEQPVAKHSPERRQALQESANSKVRVPATDEAEADGSRQARFERPEVTTKETSRAGDSAEVPGRIAANGKTERASELAAQVQGQDRTRTRTDEDSVRVDARRWSVFREAGAGNTEGQSSAGRGDTGNGRGREGQEGERSSNLRSKLTRDGGVPETNQDSGIAGDKRFLTMTEMVGELRSQTTARTSPDAGIDRKAFNDLVERARVNLQSDGRSTASIRLNPAHLGRMTLDLQMQDGRLQARLLVDNPEAERMLKQDLETLRRDLKAHGIQLESFAVRVRETTAAFDARADSDSSSMHEGPHTDAEPSNGQQQNENANAETGFAQGSVAAAEYEDAGTTVGRSEQLLNLTA